jgi:hypothetical protein
MVICERSQSPCIARQLPILQVSRKEDICLAFGQMPLDPNHIRACAASALTMSIREL